MISRPFAPPNFEVDASELDGTRWKWLTRASSEAQLVERLESEEWTVHSLKPYDFETWRARSAVLLASVRDALKGKRELEFEAKHWQRLKSHLFELFDRKCAYCEAYVRHVSSGDVEHFRPKRRVDDEPDHPGYYWLSYDSLNLLPSCERCNRGRAKMNKFPVESGTRAFDPSEVESERPLLLNPYVDRKPLKHLRFLGTGHVKPLTERGRQSIDTYRLGRRELVRQREEKIAQLETELGIGIVRKGLERAVADSIEELRTGREEYSAALLSFVGDWIEEQQSGLANAQTALPKSLRAKARAQGKRVKDRVRP